eukprot:UC1_evm1s1836
MWLLSRVSGGAARLAEGTGVVDVAGGRGDVSRQLVARGVPSTVVDPRVAHRRRDGQRVWNGPQLEEYFQWGPDGAGGGVSLDGGGREILQGASAFVGMHPDQATEPMVDYCLAHGIAFAV